MTEQQKLLLSIVRGAIALMDYPPGDGQVETLRSIEAVLDRLVVAVLDEPPY